MLLRSVEDPAGLPPPEPPLPVISANPMYAVDLDQRITCWDGRGMAGAFHPDDVLGRRCYEVLAGVDPRNASLCRPNCPVITQARLGRPATDFEVWSPLAEHESGRVGVTILLQGDPVTGAQATRVIHLLHNPGEARVPFANVARRPRPIRPRVKQAREEEAPSHPRPSLTPRQVAALRLLAEGCSPEEIAVTMEVQPITVRNHLQAAMDRLGARNRLEAVIIASRCGLLAETA